LETIENTLDLFSRGKYILAYYRDAKKITGEISCTSGHCDGKELDDSCIVVFRVLDRIEKGMPRNDIDEVCYICDVEIYCNRCGSIFYAKSEKTFEEQIEAILDNQDLRGFPIPIELPEYYSIPCVRASYSMVVDITKEEYIETR